MWNRLIIDGNAVYEIDDECIKKKQGRTPQRNGPNQDRFSRKGQIRDSGH